MAGIIACVTFPGCKVGYFRRKFTQLEGAGGAIDRSREFLASWCKWNGTKHRWTFPNGSILQFCHLQRPQDVYNYQSAQFDVILFDEGTQFTRDQYRYMATRNRATVPGIVPFMAIATNPGNIGHNWFKKEFVACGELEKVHRVEVEPGKFEDHIFIPAKLSDNQVLEKRDPGYRRNLENQPVHIRKMLLEGDWDAFEGQVFSEFSRQIHVVTPFVIPQWWKRWIGHDPGYANPFAWHWFAVSPDGIVYIYREYTREESDPKVFYSDQGAKVAELSKYIEVEDGREVEKYEKIDYIVAGLDAFNKSRETGKSYVDYYYEGGIPKSWGFVPANTDRKLRAATWHEYLKPFPHPEFPDRKIAKVQIFDTCTKLIETLPQLIADENDLEKVADDPSIDNVFDSSGYGLISWHTKQSKPPKEGKSRMQRHKEKLVKKRKMIRKRAVMGY
jgi:hypothetical protein